MASCYHDEQNFKTDFNIEVARESNILEAGQDLDEFKCDKNPGHRGFIPFKNLTLEHLPNEHRNRDILDTIKRMGRLVVRLVVEKKENGRRIKEAGSGFVLKFNNEYSIRTNNHIVKTDDEVNNCTVEFHYDDDSRSNVFTSRGVELVQTCPYRDITDFKFHPVPDFLYQHDLKNECPYSLSICILYKKKQFVIEEPLPRLSPDSLEINFYTPLDLNSPLIESMFLSSAGCSISYMKSSDFKFEPIPSNRPVFTAIKILFCYSISSIKIEIHKDEDTGNSRVIPGDVVQFGDEYAIEISESIFQDEVKKCRLVWNGEVIGRGTRLYFRSVKISDILSGVDIEQQIKRGRENFWLFKGHPIPRHVEDMLLQTQHATDMCCIGHPHGGIKMVTFGRQLSQSLERFDNRGRHITQPNPDCQGKKVGCVKYSCKTCPGSSGSPVFVLFEVVDLCYSFCHFMGERVGLVRILPNGELIKNINMAWSTYSPGKI